MKNTIRIQTVGSRSIINRFDQLPVDPETTRLKNRATLEALPEKIAVNEKINVKAAHDAKARDALRKRRIATKYIKDAETIINLTDVQEEKDLILLRTEGARNMLADETKKHGDFSAQSKACDVELSDLNNAFEIKRRAHVKANPIYSHPRKNEVVLIDSKFAELKPLFDARSNQQIAITIEQIETVVQEAIGELPEIKVNLPKFVSFQVIPDYRGKEIWFQDSGNWIPVDALELGVDISAGDIIYENLTDEQRSEVDAKKEVYRIEDLTAEQKDAEKAAAIDAAVSAAAIMKTKLEIQGSTPAAALTASRAWYDEQVVLIEAKYG